MKTHRSFFGSAITTRNLYDQVVGIGNVQIHLYKIEAQREYPITWKEVSRNSGGEGFLSAFVILSSLLYYMRRDDTDIFADKNEEKSSSPFRVDTSSSVILESNFLLIFRFLLHLSHRPSIQRPACDIFP